MTRSRYAVASAEQDPKYEATRNAADLARLEPRVVRLVVVVAEPPAWS
jgi:hypothetical protein